VDLEVSSGPAAAQIAVPRLIRLTQAAAEAALTNAGLALGTVTTAQSSIVPSGGVISTSPPAGDLASRASKVSLEISFGQRIGFWQSVWQNLPAIVFTAIGLFVLFIIINGISSQAGFLTSLSKPEVARGLITFLITIVTVGIALVLVLSTILLTGDDAVKDAVNEKRFDRGKQVLTAMIGILGTIVGFYFASLQNPPGPGQQIQITTASLPDGAVNTAYPRTTLEATGGILPLKWSVKPLFPDDLKLDSATELLAVRQRRRPLKLHTQ
jgi:hypothetical protein